MAGALAAEAAMAAEKGRVGEAVALWGSVGEYLAHLTAFEPTREAIAGVFLARAADLALLAAQAPGLGLAAGLLAKLAEMVFFRKADPDVLLEVIAQTPLPTTYDPCYVSHYRGAVRYLVAAHRVQTGGDPKLFIEWVWGGRCEAEQAEALLLFFVGAPKGGSVARTSLLRRSPLLNPRKIPNFCHA
jgi:hypothetical protein